MTCGEPRVGRPSLSKLVGLHDVAARDIEFSFELFHSLQGGPLVSGDTEKRAAIVPRTKPPLEAA